MLKTSKTQYSEQEAAQELGISIDRLRMLIRSHIVGSEEELPSQPVPALQPSDLLVLRILSSMHK